MKNHFRMPLMQHIRFSDEDPAFYDPVAKIFHDLAGYGPTNALTITTGTPAFVTESGSGRRGMTLDNTVQGGIQPACPWMGSYISVMKPDMSVNGTIYPMIWSGAATTTSNGTLRLIRGGASSYTHRLASPSGTKTPDEGNTGGILAVGYALDQSDRKSYSTVDGVTVTADSALADDNKGNGIAIGSNSTGAEGAKIRFGNLSGTDGDTTITTNKMTMFEWLVFAGNIWNDYADEAEAMMLELNQYYGLA